MAKPSVWDKLKQQLDESVRWSQLDTWLDAIEATAINIIERHDFNKCPYGPDVLLDRQSLDAGEIWDCTPVDKTHMRDAADPESLACLKKPWQRKLVRVAVEMYDQVRWLRAMKHWADWEAIAVKCLELGMLLERVQFFKYEPTIIKGDNAPAVLTAGRKEKADRIKAEVEKQAEAIHRPGMLRKILVKRIETATGIKPRTIEKYLPRTKLPK